MYKDGVKQDN